MQMWEYKVIDLTQQGPSIPTEEEENALNSLGNLGWELISVSRTYSDYSGVSARAYLKRLKQH